MSWLSPLEIGVTMGLILAWGTLSLAISFRLLNFPDLTVEGSLPIGAAVFAALARSGIDPNFSVVIALAAGAVAGMLTAFLHIRFQINKFLAAIIVVAISYSLCLHVMSGPNVSLLKIPMVFDVLSRWDATFVGPHFGRIAFLLGIVGLGGWLLLAIINRPAGIRARVAGSNPEFGASLGIEVSWYIIAGLALTNMLAAGSGVLLAMHQGFADVGMGQGILILALASMALGERLTSERSLAYPTFVVVSAVLGSILYHVLVAYAVRAGLAPNDLKLVTAIFVLVVIAFRYSRREDDMFDPLR